MNNCDYAAILIMRPLTAESLQYPYLEVLCYIPSFSLFLRIMSVGLIN